MLWEAAHRLGKWTNRSASDRLPCDGLSVDGVDKGPTLDDCADVIWYARDPERQCGSMLHRRSWPSTKGPDHALRSCNRRATPGGMVYEFDHERLGIIG